MAVLVLFQGSSVLKGAGLNRLLAFPQYGGQQGPVRAFGFGHEAKP